MAECLRPDSRKVNIYRLYSLINDAGLLVYRKVFTSYATEMSGSVSDHIDKYRLAIQESFLQGGITRVQYDRLLPGRSPLDSVDTCDLTLLAFLVRIACVEETASEHLRQQISDLDILRTFRNEIAHTHSTVEYDTDKFNRSWQKIKVAIMRIDPDIPRLEEEIDALKEKPIDPKREAELQEMMEDLRRRAAVAEELANTISQDVANRMSRLEVNQHSMLQKVDSNQATILAKMEDEAHARELNQTNLVCQLRRINMNPFMQLSGPRSIDSGISVSDVSLNSTTLHLEQMHQYMQSDGHTTYYESYQRVLTQGTVTAFAKSDYEDLSKAIGSEWPLVADHLGLSKSQIERTKAQSERKENQAYIKKMVHIWAEMEKENARIDRFIEIVVNCPLIKAERSAFECIIERHANTPQN